MISVRNLHFSYSANDIIFDDFNLQVERGCLYGLVGPNGAGKSTLISLLTGLNTVRSGSIEIAGKELNQARNELLGKMSLVPQEYAFYPKLSVMQNLEFFAHLYPQIAHPAENIEQAIVLTGLENYRKQVASKLSGGLKRRLNLAIGLLNKPDLLILDEPTVGIDPQSRQFILQAIKQLNQQGMTILYTSHYMEEVESLCDDIAIIDHGKILLSGKLDELLSGNTRLNIRTQQPVIKTEFKSFSHYPRLIIEQNQITVELDNVSEVTELLTLLQVHNYKVEQLNFGKQSLESMYFSLTERAVRE